MANPRKFSEKIALHTQKQAEETAAFEAILREVSATTRVNIMSFVICFAAESNRDHDEHLGCRGCFRLAISDDVKLSTYRTSDCAIVFAERKQKFSDVTTVDGVKLNLYGMWGIRWLALVIWHQCQLASIFVAVNWIVTASHGQEPSRFWCLIVAGLAIALIVILFTAVLYGWGYIVDWVIIRCSVCCKQHANVVSQCQQQPHVHLSQPNINIACRGRSLPNVSQMSSSSGIDLQVSYPGPLRGKWRILVYLIFLIDGRATKHHGAPW